MLRRCLTPVVIALLPSSLFALSGQEQPVGSTPVIQSNSKVAARFAKIKRIYVESLGNDSISKQMEALLVDSLTSSNRFIVTENKEHADAILKGVATEQTDHELHSTREGTVVGNLRALGGISDASTSTETIRHAHLAVRLVSPDGDVLWSTEKESTGGKYKGPAADVADQAIKQMLNDSGSGNP